MNIFNNVEEKALPVGMAWINEPEKWGFENGRLVIEVPESSDFFEDPAGVSVRSSAPFLYCEVDGDFSMTTRVDVEMVYDYDSACLMMMGDYKNWAKICFEYVNKIPTIVSVVTKDVSDDCVSEKVGKVKPYLKIQRSGNCFGLHYSLDSINWTMVRYFKMELPRKIRIGVVGQCPVGKQSKVNFDFLEVIQKNISNPRIVE